MLPLCLLSQAIYCSCVTIRKLVCIQELGMVLVKLIEKFTYRTKWKGHVDGEIYDEEILSGIQGGK
jgi:hypothetical protein